MSDDKKTVDTNSKNQDSIPTLTNDKKPRNNNALSILLIIAIIVVASLLIMNVITAAKYSKDYNAKTTVLKDFIFSDQELENAITTDLGGTPDFYTVFISIKDDSSKMNIFSATGETLETAYNEAVLEGEAFVNEEKLTSTYFQADIVNLSEFLTVDELANYINQSNGDFIYGISIDPQFQTPLLNTEITKNNIINYNSLEVDLENLKNYLYNDYRKVIAKLPDNFTIFSTRTYVNDDNNCVALN